MGAEPAAANGALDSIEVRSFDYVPETERHGKPRQVFYMWFGQSATVFSLVTGYVGITLGLSFWWTLVAILLGNVLGALFMAFHAAQGPKLGLPQMIQSRAQFGYYGSMLPLLVVWFMYIAFVAIDTVLAGEGFQAVWHWSLDGWMIVLTIPMLIVAIYGYEFINKYNKYETWLFVAVFLGLTVYMFVHGVGHGSLTRGHFIVGPFLLSASIVASYQITYAPYVSDYTRYLPVNTTHKVFWRTYAGTVISCGWLMILGAGIAVLNPKLTTMLLEIKELTGPLGGAMAILIAIGLIVPNAGSLYGGMMTTVTLANNVNDRIESTRVLRSIVCLFIAVVSVLVATAGAGSFMTNLEDYMTMILYILIPWSVINLTDYYLLHHGTYRTEDFYAKNGHFGRVNVSAMIVYLLVFGIEVPFMHTTIYEGPVAKHLGGGDIAWIVGAVVTVPLYIGVIRLRRRALPVAAAGDGQMAEHVVPSS